MIERAKQLEQWDKAISRFEARPTEGFAKDVRALEEFIKTLKKIAPKRKDHSMYSDSKAVIRKYEEKLAIAQNWWLTTKH